MTTSISMNAYKTRFGMLLFLVLALASCQSGTTTNPAAPGEAATDESGENADGGAIALTQRIRITGTGASFPAPLYQNWGVQVAQKEPNLQVNYQSIGSGAGIEQFTGETVDFGASDVAMTDEQMAAVTRGTILLPMTAGSIVLAYNLQGVDTGLKLTRDAYVGILSSQITNWNDPAIADANPDVNLPDRQITVVFRSDGSGTTGVLTKHLSAISPEWANTIGEGTAVEWPSTGSFVGNRGNEGVTAQIQNVNGAIGYVEYGFATNNGLAVAALENQSGNFIIPTDESAEATLAAVELPDNLRAFITDPEGEDSYPIVTYTWMMLYEDQPDPVKSLALEKWIEFGLNEGQEQAPALGYVRLPDNVRERVAAAADVMNPDYTITLK